MPKSYLVLDFETRSEANLKKTGAFVYSQHPTTKLLCTGWKHSETKEGLLKVKAECFSRAFTKKTPEVFLEKMHDPNVMVVAHNAFFEQCITKHVMKLDIPIKRWICTMSMTCAHALPRDLERGAKILGSPIEKDMVGRRLMLKYSKPRKATKNNQAKFFSKSADLRRLMQYCAGDVDVEAYIFNMLPELEAHERAVWELDQKINFRGFPVDREHIEAAIELMDREKVFLDERICELTNNTVTSATQRERLLNWLKDQGINLPNLQAPTVKKYEHKHEALAIRKAVSKSSTKKYYALEAFSRGDSRIRGTLIYWGASTGRWAGGGPQPHNFPRIPVDRKPDISEMRELIRNKDLDTIRLLYGEPMEVLAHCLRPTLRSKKNFYGADFSAIEARLLFWFSRNKYGLQAFHEGRDLYKEMASVIYKKPVEEINDDERYIGKKVTLAAGYSMGPEKFKLTCEREGIKVTEDLADEAIEAYRTVFSPVVEFWKGIEQTAIQAVLRKKKLKYRGTVWWTDERFLYCQLPSGRKISFFGPEVRKKSFMYKPRPKKRKLIWDEETRKAVYVLNTDKLQKPRKLQKLTLYHWAVNPLTKKWENHHTHRGTLCENVVQGTARDVMVESMLRTEKAGYEVGLTVHDELLTEHEKGSLKEFQKIVSVIPKWVDGLPLKVESWTGQIYEK